MPPRIQVPKLPEGLPDEVKRPLLAWCEQVVDALNGRSFDSAAPEAQQATVRPRAGETVRVSPPAAGMGLVLPPPGPDNRGQAIQVFIEAPDGDLRVFVAPSSSPNASAGGTPTVNGATTVTFDSEGLVTFVSNGSNRWNSSNQFAAESAASTWAGVLANGHTAGTNNPFIPVGQFIGFGSEGSLPANGTIRSSGEFEIETGNGGIILDSNGAGEGGGFISLFAPSIKFDSESLLDIDADNLDMDLTGTANMLSANSFTITTTDGSIVIDANGASRDVLITADDEIDLTATGVLDQQGSAVTIDSTTTTLDLTAATVMNLNGGTNLVANANAGSFLGSGSVHCIFDAGNTVFFTAGNAVDFRPTGDAIFRQATTEKFRFRNTGAFALNGFGNVGTTGQLFMSQGNTSPIYSQTVTASYGDGTLTLAKMADLAAGTVIGRQIDASTGVPVALTGAEQGENVRFADASVSVSGSQTQWDLSSLGEFTVLLVTTTATTNVHAIDQSVLSAADDKPIIIHHTAGEHDLVFEHESGGAAETEDRIICPGSKALNVPRRHTAILWRTSNRWRVYATAWNEFDSSYAGIVPASTGSATEYLGGDGNWGAITGRFLGRTTYTGSSGTHTYNAQTNTAHVRVVGGGGGGGGAPGTTSGEASAGGGGSAGEVLDFVASVTGGGGEAYSIGGGGAGGTGGTGGTTGSSSTFIGTAAGGSGGLGGTATTGVNVAAGGTTASQQSAGGTGVASGVDVVAVGGPGGSSGYIGGGGAGARHSSAGGSNGSAGRRFGSGGGGAASVANGTDRTGGAGSGGIVIIDEYT